MVTVVLVDIEENKAEAVVKDLLNKLKGGNLELIAPDKSRLSVPAQDLEIFVPSDATKSSRGMRVVVYGVVAGTLAVIGLFVLIAVIFKRKRSQLMVRMPRLSIDDAPTYRQFHNEFSLDGTAATLARYRRDPQPLNETCQ